MQPESHTLPSAAEPIHEGIHGTMGHDNVGHGDVDDHHDSPPAINQRKSSWHKMQDKVKSYAHQNRGADTYAPHSPKTSAHDIADPGMVIDSGHTEPRSESFNATTHHDTEVPNHEDPHAGASGVTHGTGFGGMTRRLSASLQRIVKGPNQHKDKAKADEHTELAHTT